MGLSFNDYMEQLEFLLNKEIDEFNVGIEKIGSKIVHGMNEYILKEYKLYLPAYLGGGRFFFHATAYFRFKNEEQGILLEYGGKPKEKIIYLVLLAIFLLSFIYMENTVD